MKKSILFLIYFAYMGIASSVMATTPNQVVFLNTGRLYIASQAGVSIYIPDAIRMLSVSGGDSVKVVLNGRVELGGDFYQDAHTTVFYVDSVSGRTASTGTLAFVTTRGVNRFVTTQSESLSSFDRGLYYIAFPHVEIGTNDSIILPAKMGMDALSVHRASGQTGYLVLRSDTVGEYVFNASLRSTSTTTSSESAIDLGAVLIEQEMKAYRTGTQLFAFATPFKGTQLSGYFAGNWVRKPQNGTYGHCTYVLGNKPSVADPSVISSDQYVTDALEPLVPAQAYLIKPRPAGFDYSTLQTTGGLTVTGASASAYDLDKFFFNGMVYTIPAYQEQVYAEDVLYTNSIPTGVTLTSTVNWLIGNSYTCAISTKRLAQQMESSGLLFAPTIYIFPAGSTSYQPLTITGSGDAIVVSDATEIPAMSIFMIRVAKGQTVTGSGIFSIGKESLVHGNASQDLGFRTVAIASPNQVLFRISPINNERIYDLAAIGIRPTAVLGSDAYDIAKVYAANQEGFQLYTVSATGSRLSANGVPQDVDTVKLGLKPAPISGMYRISASYVESLSTEGIWLEDKLTNTTVDLKTNPTYSFTTNPTDSEDRFTVHFKRAATNLGKTNGDQNLVACFSNGNLLIKNLNESDINAKINIYDVQGKLEKTTIVSNYPTMIIPVDLAKGNYVFQLKSKRTIALKLIK